MNLTEIKQKNKKEADKLFTQSLIKPEDVKSLISQSDDRIIDRIRSMIDDLDDDGVIHTSEIKKVLNGKEKELSLSEWLKKHGYHSLSTALEKNQKKSGKTEKENNLEKIKELRQSLQSINENIDWLEGVKMDTEDEIGVLELWIDKDEKEL